MGITSVTELNAAVSGQGTPGVERGACPLCERQGLPILPVRYAVCQRTRDTAAIPELPASRIQDFTEVTLGQALVEGSPTPRTLAPEVKEAITDATDSQVSKYILRQLRPGYLYLFDEANHPYFWYAYAITPDGMFYQFSVQDTPPPVSEADFDCGRKPEDEKRAKALNASVVTLPSVETSQTLYYAFTEHPWSREHLRMIEREGAWRDRHMQKIDIPAWIGGNPQPHAFGIEELELVAEYSEGAAGLASLFWPDNSGRRLFSREQLLEVMQERLSHAPGRMKDRGLILAVKDEVGITDELNAYRHRQMDLLEDFLDQEDDEGVANRRNLASLNAIEAFKAHYELARRQEGEEQLATLTRHPDYRIERTRQRLAEVQAEIQALRDRGEIGYWDADRLRLGRLEQEARDLQRTLGDEARLHELIRDAPLRLVEDYNTQLEECYQEASLNSFAEKYYRVLAQTTQLVEAFDADYAFWLRDHLAAAMERYSQREEDYAAGLGLSGLVANGLRGGIMGPGSAAVWMDLAREIDSADSLLRKALFFLQPALIDSALRVRRSLGSGQFVTVDTLLTWKEIHRRRQALAPDIGYDANMALLATTVGDALSSLAINELKHPEQAAGAQDALQSFIRYFQLVHVGQQEVQGSSGTDNLPLLASVTVKRSHYHAWMEQISRGVNANGRVRHADSPREALEFFDVLGAGGNFAVRHVEHDTDIEVVIPIDSADVDILERLNAHLEDFDREDANQRAWQARQSARSLVGQIVAAGGVATRDAGLTRASGIFAKGLVFYNAVGVLIQELATEDRDGWKLAGAVVNLGTVGVAVGLGYAQVQRAATGRAPAHAGRLIFARTGLTVAGGALAIVDGVKKLGEADEGRKQGLPDSLMVRRSILGGLAAAGGAISLIGLGVSGAPFVAGGLLVAFFAAVLGYRFVELVAPSVAMWVNRSRYGNHDGQLAAFEDVSDELASLEMVFEGVTVAVTWDEVSTLSGPSGHGVNVQALTSGIHGPGKKIKIAVTVPDLDEMELSLELASGKGRDRSTLFKYGYKKAGQDRDLEPMTQGDFSQDASSMGDIDNKGGFYRVALEKHYSDSSLGNGVDLVVTFLDSRYPLDIKEGFFPLRF